LKDKKKVRKRKNEPDLNKAVPTATVKPILVESQCWDYYCMHFDGVHIIFLLPNLHHPNIKKRKILQTMHEFKVTAQHHEL
jgi:hypothetical protein